MSETPRLRVLHVGKFYPPVSGGMERVLQLLCERERTRLDTRVLVANTTRTTVHEVVDGVSVTRAANFGAVGSVAICPAFPLLLSRERADVVVIHEPNPLGLLAYMLARPAARLVVWFHSEVVRDRWKYALFYKPWFAFAMRRASRVIVASPPMTAAEQLRPFPVPTTVIPYGVDHRRLEKTPDVAARAEALRAVHAGPLILFVGRMVPYKGLDVLVRAMVDVPATAVLVGDGPQRPRLEAMAAELGVQSRVVFAGELDEAQLVAWYHACDVFALPSTTRAEAFGVVQTEAMTCGKPVVSTSVPSGVPWVNQHGETGLVVPPGDAAALATALNRLVADPALRRRMGEAGQRRVAEEFTADRMSARAVDVYRDVAGGSPQRRAMDDGSPMQEQLAAIIRGDAHAAATGDPATLLEEARRQGVHALIADRAQASIGSRELHAAARAGIAGEAALDAIRQRELSGVLAALAARGVDALLLKGSALAYTLYPNPALRPRFDADLLVRREAMDAVAEVMTARGYGRPRQVTGDLVMHQLDYTRRDVHGVWHVYDFHWKLANRLAVADMLSFDELAHASTPIAALGPHARGLAPIHALMLACVHRVAHHPSDERLIWIYDIHLLAQALDDDERAVFVALAVDRGVSAVCADGLRQAQRWFGTGVPAGMLRALSPPHAPQTEPSAAFLRPDGTRAEELLSDLRALPDWSQRLRLLYEHAFPSPAYMSGMYAVSNRAVLPALYAHRIVRGAWKWFRRGPR